MGTRSLTVLVDGRDQKETAVIYRQFDGYPTGHGTDLKNFLDGFQVVNGIPGNRGENQRVANGPACLFAQLVGHLKEINGHEGDVAGNIYLEPAGSRNMGEEFIYTVTVKEGSIRLKVQSGRVTFFGDEQEQMQTVFDGPLSEFNPATCEKAEESA